MSRPVWTPNLRRPRQPERNRLIVALKTAAPELSFAEIGARVNATRNAVAGVLDRARKRAQRQEGPA